MIPETIIQYLQRNHVPFERRPHLRAITAQALAASLHETGFKVAKTVVVRAPDRLWLAVVAAPDTVFLDRLADTLGVERLRLADESEFANAFPGCEVGAEPPFGHLYGLPVVMDEHLRHEDRLLFRAGSHEEAIQLRIEDFVNLEAPTLDDIIHAREGEARYVPSEAHP